LDTRSGLFYEQTSDFFYDPKTSLYFGNKAQAYFRHDPTAKPEFVPVQQQQPQQQQAHAETSESEKDAAASQDPTSNDDAGSSAEEKVPKEKAPDKSKKSISFGINLASKKKAPQIKLDSAVAAAVAASKQAAPQVKVGEPPSSEIVRKRHSSDIAKWIERSQEDVGTCTRPQKRAATVTGKPVCLLCKRKFADMQKLRAHEEKSALHKENVLKAAKVEQAKNKEYKDRASQRRGMWGPTVDLSGAPQNEPDIMKPREVSSTGAIRPEETLGGTNVGNKMLQKLGWKKGEELGKSGGDTSESSQFLRQDWKKIETLAAGPGAGAGRRHHERGHTIQQGGL